MACGVLYDPVIVVEKAGKTQPGQAQGPIRPVPPPIAPTQSPTSHLPQNTPNGTRYVGPEEVGAMGGVEMGWGLALALVLPDTILGEDGGKPDAINQVGTKVRAFSLRRGLQLLPEQFIKSRLCLLFVPGVVSTVGQENKQESERHRREPAVATRIKHNR